MVGPTHSSSSSSSSPPILPPMDLKTETLGHIKTHFNENRVSKDKIIAELKGQCLTTTAGVSKTWDPKHQINQIKAEGKDSYLIETTETKKSLFGGTKVIDRTFRVAANDVNRLALAGTFGPEVQSKADNARIIGANRQKEERRVVEEFKAAEMKVKVEAARRDALGSEGRFNEDLGECVEKIGKDDAKRCHFLRNHEFPIGTKSTINSFVVNADKSCTFAITEYNQTFRKEIPLKKIVSVTVSGSEMQNWHEGYLKAK